MPSITASSMSPGHIPTSLKDVLTSENSWVVYALEVLGLWQLASSQIGVILISFESSDGKQQLNMRDAMLALITKIITVHSDRKRSKGKWSHIVPEEV